MNNIEALIESFEKKGIHLFMDGEKLRYKASKELMTAEVLSQLKAHKAEIIEQLKSIDTQNKYLYSRPQTADSAEAENKWLDMVRRDAEKEFAMGDVEEQQLIDFLAKLK